VKQSSTIQEALARAIDRGVEKLGSGQWWLCISCAFVFAYLGFVRYLSEATVASIITMVVIFYFKRDRQATLDSNGGTEQLRKP